MRGVGKLRGLPDLSGRQRKPALPELPTIRIEQEDISPEEERRREIARLVGDDSLAYRVMKLQNKYPKGTLPELVTMDWLEKQGIGYQYQVHLFGGRRGGLIPDFVIQNGGQVDAWMIQGKYWHTIHGKREVDAAAKMRMRGADFGSGRIKDVLELWDSRIYKNRPSVFWAALSGQEMGP